MTNEIGQAIRRARRDDGTVDVDLVVNGIFAMPGQKHAFLFNQNARRTNIQIAELLSLVRRHTYIVGTRQRQSEIEFTTFDEVKSFLEEVLAHGNVSEPVGFEAFVEQLTLGDEFSNVLAIAPAGDFKKSSDAFRKAFPGKTQKTIFLIADSDIVPRSRFPGSRKFYILYLQRYKNNNVYHLYDENKPGWASHTTLPHSLAGAMISIARPWFRDQGSAEVADPFGGSGTVFFEAQKIAGLNCRSSDKAPIFQYAMQDNATFFGLPKNDLVRLRDELASFSDVVPEYWEGGTRRRGRQNICLVATPAF